MRITRTISFILIILISATCLFAQNSKIRNIDSNSSQYQNNSSYSTSSVRIENGKVWVNGNLIPKTDLPKSLHNINPDFYYQAAIFGNSDISFLLMGTEYLVRDGKIMEVVSRNMAGNSVETNNKANQEAYYSQLKNESPGIFYSLNREAALYEQVRKLVLEYQLAQGKQKDKIREEIRVVLDQLFEINEYNREQEIRQLEQMIDAAKKEVEHRKMTKDKIIDDTMGDLIGE